jgi:hypothetical protein
MAGPRTILPSLANEKKLSGVRRQSKSYMATKSDDGNSGERSACTSYARGRDAVLARQLTL